MKRLPVVIWLLFWTAMLFSQPPQTPNEVFRLGAVSYQQGNYDLSYKCFSDAINLDPNRYYFYYNRGLSLIALGNNTGAAADFKKSIDLKPSAEAYCQLGMMAYQQGNMTEARTALESAYELREDMGNVNFTLGLIYFRDKQYAEGYKYFGNCVQHNYSNSEVNYYKGYCEAELGLHDQAMQSLLFAATNNSKDWRYYMKMYEVYKLLSEKQLALNNLSMVIELGQNKPEFYLERAELFKATGQESRADEDTKMAITLKDPTLSEAEHK